MIISVFNIQEENTIAVDDSDSRTSTDKVINVTVQTTRTAQLRTYEFQEEKQAWMLLVRQAILDCQYLDKAAEECVIPHSILSTLSSKASASVTPTATATATTKSIPSSPAITSPSIVNQSTMAYPTYDAHAATFAKSILSILDTHNKSTFTRCVGSLVSSMRTLSCTEMTLLCDMKSDQSHSGGIETNPFARSTARSRNNSNMSLNTELDPRSVCLYPDPYLARTAVGQRTALVKSVVDRMGDLITSCFSDICADYKPVIEICGVASSVVLKKKNEKDKLT